MVNLDTPEAVRLIKQTLVQGRITSTTSPKDLFACSIRIPHRHSTARGTNLHPRCLLRQASSRGNIFRDKLPGLYKNIEGRGDV